MPFVLPLLFLCDLCAAAFTFSIVASVPMWRRSAITAPVFVFIAAPIPSLALVMVFPLKDKTFLDFDFKTALILLLLTAVSLIAAYAAGLICRFAFRTAAPRVEELLGLRPFLLLRVAILCGGMLSLLVLLILGANVARQIWLWGPHQGAIAAGLVCAVGVVACFLALLRLGNPQQYLPRPLPESLGQHIYGSRGSA